MSRINLNNTTLWTALVTPLTEQGDIDFATLNHLVAAQQQANNGILLLGSTGEGLALNAAEQRNVVEHVLALNPTVPVMVAVGGYDLNQQLAWIEYCNQLNIAGYLLATPMYAKPGPQGQAHWFGQLLDAASHPCMIYNVPSRSGINLDVATLGNLSEHQNFWALKEASGDLDLFAQYVAACPSVLVFSGDDGLFPQQAAIGAQGLVSVCSNAWPQATHSYVEYHLSHRNEAISEQWQQALDALCFGAANPIPVKVLMRVLGQLPTATLRAPLTHLELDSIEHLVTADHAVNTWHNSHLEVFSPAVETA